MDDGVRGALYRLKGLADNVLPGLGEHLHRHIIGDHIPLDQRAHKIVLRLGGGGKTDLDFLKTDIHKHPEEFKLFLKAHRFDQGLVAVS